MLSSRKRELLVKRVIEISISIGGSAVVLIAGDKEPPLLRLILIVLICGAIVAYCESEKVREIADNIVRSIWRLVCTHREAVLIMGLIIIVPWLYEEATCLWPWIPQIGHQPACEVRRARKQVAEIKVAMHKGDVREWWLATRRDGQSRRLLYMKEYQVMLEDGMEGGARTRAYLEAGRVFALESVAPGGEIYEVRYFRPDLCNFGIDFIDSRSGRSVYLEYDQYCTGRLKPVEQRPGWFWLPFPVYGYR